MTEVVKVEQVKGVDLATVSGIVLPGRDVTPMTRFHRLNIQHLQFRVEHGHKVGYKDGQNLYMHANNQLDAIFMAAGAEVLTNEVVTSDDQGNSLPANVFRHHFAAKIVLPSGKVAQADCYKTWDLRSLEEGGARAEASLSRRRKTIQKVWAKDRYAKWPKGLKEKGAQETEDEFWDRANIFLERAVEDEMIERRVFGQELAESGAKSRACYDMTGLKMGVPKAEFEQDVWVVTSLFNVEEALEKMAGTQEGQQLLALVALAQEQAFGAMGGNAIPGGAEALKLLKTVQDMTPQDVEEAIEDPGEKPDPIDLEDLTQEAREGNGETIETDFEIQPPGEEDEPVPADVQALIDETMAEEMGVGPEPKPAPPVEKTYPAITSDEREAFGNYLTWCGYEGVKWKNLLKTLFGENCTMGTISRLQAKIACQYARFCKDEAAKGIHDRKMLKAVKDGRKVLARQAYEMGKDIDEYIAHMAGRELK